MTGSRRNPLRQAALGPKSNDNDSGTGDDDRSESPSSDDGSPIRRPQRSSARSTKFQKSMKEPGNGIQDLLLGSIEADPTTPSKATKTTEKSTTTASPRQPKSPAVRHSSRRRRMRIEVPVADDELNTSDEEESEEASEGDAEDQEDGDEEEEEEDEESLKIQRIVASRSESRRKWKEICHGLHTSEIEYGSRWFAEEKADPEEGYLDAYEERFLVKWSDLSYMHCSWETEDDLVQQVEGAKTYLTTFFRKSENGYLFSADERCDGEYFDPAFVQIDRVLAVDNSDKVPTVESDDPVIAKYGIVMDKEDKEFDDGTGRQLLVKWGNTPYSDATYEFERDLMINDVEYVEHLAAFEKRSQKPAKSEMKRILNTAEAEKRRSYRVFGDRSNLTEEERDEQVKSYQKILEEHIFQNGGQLRDYQAEGVTWLMSNYVNARSSILADEMGLGKTIQTAAFVDLVATRMNRRGPFLIVAPLSTIPHWYREFTGWTDLNTIVYHGSAIDRECIREFEFAFECDRPKNGLSLNQSYLKRCVSKSRARAERIWMAQVVITTPEMLVTDDYGELTAVEWDAIVVDEAHRLKNHNSKLASNLRDGRFSFEHSLLLTGTPIQNDMKELWTLLNFIDPKEYDNLSSFLEQFGDIKSKERIDELHESIRPYILRRLKEDVEKSVPPKEETIIEVELTLLQKQYYRALYEKNVQFLHKNKKKALDGPSLNNLSMQLRKCCNHPFLLNGVEEEVRLQDTEGLPDGDFLAKASGKLVLLDKLLPRLKETGHKVLLFSQFRIMLDLLEDYLSAREMKAERIDGSITGHKRQMAIDRFQNPPSDGSEGPFIMLLSTRAGGVGINLTAADTCIIFDSDWNPQNDAQAQSRCHRIGQTKSVKVYRLLTRKTYEMQMFHLASMKLGLDQAVLQGFENGSASGEGALTKEEIEKLLRHGAYDIFNEVKAGTAEAESNDFVQQDIDSILARRSKTIVHDNTGTGSSAAGGTFSKASFKAPKTPNATQTTSQSDEIDIDDPEFWKKMVGDDNLNNAEGDDLAGKKRKRNKANYSEVEFDRKIEGVIATSDSGSSSAEFDSETDDSISDTAMIAPEELMTTAPGTTEPADPSAKRRKTRKEKARWGGTRTGEWSKTDANALLKSLQSYGYGNLSWEEFRERTFLGDVVHAVDSVKRMSWSMLLVILCEAAQEDAQSSKRRAGRVAEKRRASEGSSSEQRPTEGGVLGNPEALETDGSVGKDDVQAAFAKLLSSNAAWVSDVFQDATQYAQRSAPRPKVKLDHALHEYAGKKAVQSKKGMLSLFVESLWPSLKSRGWTTEQLSEGTYSGITHYRHGGNEYRSPQAVLNAIPALHPELSGVVENIKSAAADESEKLAKSAKVIGELDSSSVTTESLCLFLDMFAPLQLLVDRAQPRGIALTRKTLSICSYMKNAYSVVRNASTGKDESSVGNRISKFLSPDKRMALPHPGWNQVHDAILIQAIVKHGWIEHDRACRAISDDSEVRWGAPFDDTGPASKPKVNNEGLKETASRVAEFLNTESAMLDELKAFNLNLLVNGYRLQKLTEDSEWSIDETTLHRGWKGAKASDSIKELQETAELPTKRDLLKRAKSLLSRSPEMFKPKPPTVAIENDNHGFVLLDQSDPCNIFLAEIVRTLMKSSITKNSKVKNLGQKLCAETVREAEYRRDAIVATSSAAPHGILDGRGAVMEKIVEQLKLVARSLRSSPRQSKNVLKVMLGLPPVSSKSGESLFPVVGLSELELVNGNGQKPSRQQGPVAPSGKKKRHASGTSAERAVSRASAKVRIASMYNRRFSSGASELELDSTEVLLLSVICSQGIPVWTEHWSDLIAENDTADAELQGPGHVHALTWFGLASVFTSAAQAWHKLALKKLMDMQSEYDDKFLNEQAVVQLELLKTDERFQCHTLSLAGEFRRNPLAFAKKVIMLMETLRRRMGPVESRRGGSVKKIQSMNKSENGLGPVVLTWLGRELCRWAKSFDITDHTGRPHPFTTSTFAHSSPQYTDDDKLGVSGLFDKKACRAVFAQSAQQTRVRSIFVKKDEDDVRSVVQKASKNCRAMGEMWTQQPSWWQAGNNNDFQLLCCLLECGYSGLEEAFAMFHPSSEASEENTESNTRAPSMELTKRGAQERANPLTRELHAIDDTAEAIRFIEKIHPVATKGDKLDAGGRTSDFALTQVPAAQPGIASFFKQTAKKREMDMNVLNGKADSSNVDREGLLLSPEKRAGQEVSGDLPSKRIRVDMVVLE